MKLPTAVMLCISSFSFAMEMPTPATKKRKDRSEDYTIEALMTAATESTSDIEEGALSQSQSSITENKENEDDSNEKVVGTSRNFQLKQRLNIQRDILEKLKKIINEDKAIYSEKEFRLIRSDIFKLVDYPKDSEQPAADELIMYYFCLRQKYDRDSLNFDMYKKQFAQSYDYTLAYEKSNRYPLALQCMQHAIDQGQKTWGCLLQINTLRAVFDDIKELKEIKAIQAYFKQMSDTITREKYNEFEHNRNFAKEFLRLKGHDQN